MNLRKKRKNRELETEKLARSGKGEFNSETRGCK